MADNINGDNFKECYRRHIADRGAGLKHLKFPFASLRPGQAEVMQEVSKCLVNGTTYLLNAPTGFGKTQVCLLPALSCLGKHLIKRIYYFTNQEAQRVLPVKLLQQLNTCNELHLWSLTMYSVQKSCSHHDFCYFSVNKKLLQEIAQDYLRTCKEHIDFEQVQTLAANYNVCPYLLQNKLAEYMDLVILDYNYLLDPLQTLACFKSDKEKYALLLDEAHNLRRRGENIFHCQINLNTFVAYRRRLQKLQAASSAANAKNLSELIGRLDLLLDFCRKIAQLLQQKDIDRNKLSACLEISPENSLLSQDSSREKQVINFYSRQPLPQFNQLFLNFWQLWQEFWQSEKNVFAENWGELRKFQDEIAKFKRLQFLITNYCPGFINIFSYLTNAKGHTLLFTIHCLDAMPLIKAALPANSAKIFFSATLLPPDYYKKMLCSAAERCIYHAAPSPFDPAKRRVALLAYADLSYSNRQSNYELVAKSLLAYLKIVGGHLLVFAPSYRYAEILAQRIKLILPQNVRLIVQTANTAAVKEQFLRTLQDRTDPSPLLALAVMQGSFSEGLDLPHKSITAIAIISVNYPAKSDLLSLAQEYYQSAYNTAGQNINDEYDNQILAADYYENTPENTTKLPNLSPAYLFTQLYPGFSKILQACGRLIRSEEDEGDLLLLDARFTQPQFQDLLKEAFGSYAILDSLAEYVAWLRNLPKSN